MRPAVAFLLLALAGPALADDRPPFPQDRIVEVEIFGNTTTTTETVQAIAGVKVGDWIEPTTLYDVRDRLESSGLFATVEQPYTSPRPDGTRLTINVKDKFPWIIAPTFYNQPGNVGGGVGYGHNNLFGKNKKILLYGQYATADKLFLAGYLDPSIYGTRWYFRVDTFLRRERVTEFAAPTTFLGQPEPERETTLTYLNAGALVGVHGPFSSALDARVRGAKVSYDDTVWAEGVDPVTHPMPPVPPDVDGYDVSLELKVTRDQRVTWHGITNGTLVLVGYELSLPGVSDYDYWLLTSRAMWARRLPYEQNLQLKLQLGLGHHMPFQQEMTSGGTNLRGYQNRQFRGDTRAALTTEYSVPLFKIQPLAFRALVFWDTAYTSFTQNEGNAQRDYLAGQTDDRLGRWKNGIGGGFRIYVRSVILPLLGLDLGYGLEANDFHVYFAVGLTEI